MIFFLSLRAAPSSGISLRFALKNYYYDVIITIIVIIKKSSVREQYHLSPPPVKRHLALGSRVGGKLISPKTFLSRNKVKLLQIAGITVEATFSMHSVTIHRSEVKIARGQNLAALQCVMYEKIDSPLPSPPHPPPAFSALRPLPQLRPPRPPSRLLSLMATDSFQNFLSSPLSVPCYSRRKISVNGNQVTQ